RIKLADRLDNMRDVLTGVAPPEKRQRYIAETARLLEACAGACPSLEEELRKALADLKAQS
ncbi:MAG: hypothetical protein NTW87_32185, partial [Planctomycetota bacterium]|nr:hypothetical protein [Planctomycetota bacterium]